MSTDAVQLSIRLALLVLVAVLLQTSAVAQLALFGATPDIVPLVVISVGLLAGPVPGAVTGFSMGVFVDFVLLQTLGVSSLVLVIVGHFAGRLRETVRDPEATLLPLAAGAAGTAVALVVFSIMQFLLGVEAPVSLELFRQILATVLINTLIALPVHALVRRALGPALPDSPKRRRRRSTSPLSPLTQP
ncbi:MAG: rod shape-determining protein MreD [Actinomycetota bacterium]|nr:rod shape-determining protein MreD [Actinomycetota bacterium]